MRQRRRHRTSSCSADTTPDEDVLGKEDVDEIVEVESEAVMGTVSCRDASDAARLWKSSPALAVPLP